jgi:hypothetical protein
MAKANRREAVVLFLFGLGQLGGCSLLRVKPAEDIPPPVDPSLPQACVWLPLPYKWSCLDWEQFKAAAMDGTGALMGPVAEAP